MGPSCASISFAKVNVERWNASSANRFKYGLFPVSMGKSESWKIFRLEQTIANLDQQTRGWDSSVSSAEPVNRCCGSADRLAFFFSSFDRNSRSFVWVGPNPFSVLPANKPNEIQSFPFLPLRALLCAGVEVPNFNALNSFCNFSFSNL